MTQEELFETYYKRVVNFICGKVMDIDLAEDLASTVFLKICNKFDEYDDSKASLSTWVFTIANNTVIDYYRTRKVHESVEGDELDFASNEDIEQGILNEEMLEELADALLKLKEKERDLLILHYYKDYTLKEVALKMGMSYANAKVIHKKAIENLRKIMPID